MNNKNESSLKLSLMFCGLLSTSSAFAALTTTPNPLPDITLNAWYGSSGNLVGTSNFCIISTRGNNRRRQDFDAAGYQRTPSGTNGFVIAHTVSGHQLDIDMVFKDPWGVSYSLTNYSVTGFLTPQITGPLNCAEGSSSLEVTLSAAQLAYAQAGIYRATLGFDVMQISGSYSGVLDFQVNMPELVQISRLNDIIIPTGMGNAVATESFCVFRNGQGNFSVQVSGLNDVSGQLHLKNIDMLPYQVEIGQSGAFYSLTSGFTLLGSYTNFSGSSVRDCGGADNTELRVTLLSQDISAAMPGTYTDALTIMISPN